MLQDAILPIDLGQGVDSKTDPKLVVPGKLLRLENAVFTKAKQLAKRNGYSALSTVVASVGTLTAPRLCHSLNDELIVSDSGRLLSWSPNQSAWVSRGEYTSVELSRSVIDQSTLNNGFTDCAILGNYALYGWSTGIQTLSTPAPFPPLVYSSTYGSVVDRTTGSVVSVVSGNSDTSSVLLSNKSVVNNTVVKCVTLGASALMILYTNVDNTAVVGRLVQFSGSGVVEFTTETTLTTDFDGYTFDVVSTSTGAALLYGTSTGVTVAAISTAGAVTATAAITDAGASGPFHISNNAGNLWAYWCNGSGQDIKYSVLSSALATILATTTAVNGTTSFDVVTNIISLTTSATTQTIYYGVFEEITIGVFGSLIDRTDAVPVTSAGVVGAATTFAHGVAPFSRPATISSKSYAVFGYRGYAPGLGVDHPQPTAFMVRIDALADTGIPAVVGRFASGVAATQAFLGTPDGVFKTNQGMIAFAPNLSAIDATSVLLGFGVTTQEYETDYFIDGISPPPGGLSGSWAYTFDFDGDEAYTAVNMGEMAVLSGACLHGYDGQQVNELGFHLYPELLLNGATTVGGAMATGTYSYIAIYQWTDANGNLHQSAPSLPVEITLAGAGNSVEIAVNTAFLSQKRGVSVAIYRSKEASSGAGGNYYLVTKPTFLTYASAQSDAYVTYTDLLSDAQINGNPLAYTYPGSSVLENTAPPPCMVMLAHNNRLWMVDAEEPSSVWYTKSFQQFVGISPSAFLVDQIDPKFGPITALGEMDEKIVLFKEHGIFYRSGDGANDNGQNSTLSFPQLVPSDVGCLSNKSVVLIPNGIMFKSANGIYMLSRGLTVNYLGLEVEQYNSQRITNARLIEGKSQVRFLCETGLTLVYDYIFNQWSTFTNHTGLSAANWRGAYSYVTTGGAVYVENVGFLDDTTPFVMLLQTSWLALASVQGFQRVKWVVVLGDYVNGATATHGLRVRAAYDFSSSLSNPVAYTFGSAGTSGVFQYRERLQRQKCDAISLVIDETNASDSTSYIDLTNLSFIAGVKRGSNKLAQSKTVG
jgi:hypothetical protein